MRNARLPSDSWRIWRHEQPMKLLTDEIRRGIPALRSQEQVADPVVFVKFFDPCGSWTWYATEGQPEEDDFCFFGMVHGHEKELGYFMLSELESFRGPLGLGIERDLYFAPKKLSEI